MEFSASAVNCSRYKKFKHLPLPSYRTLIKKKSMNTTIQHILRSSMTAEVISSKRRTKKEAAAASAKYKIFFPDTYTETTTLRS